MRVDEVLSRSALYPQLTARCSRQHAIKNGGVLTSGRRSTSPEGPVSICDCEVHTIKDNRSDMAIEAIHKRSPDDKGGECGEFELAGGRRRNPLGHSPASSAPGRSGNFSDVAESSPSPVTVCLILLHRLSKHCRQVHCPCQSSERSCV